MSEQLEIPKSTEKQRRYYEKHRESWNKYQREYKLRRYKEDPAYRFRVKEYMRDYYKTKNLC